MSSERGFSIIVQVVEPDIPVFIFQHNAITPVPEAVIEAKVPISLRSQTNILYCPWCGVKLHKHYRNALAQMLSGVNPG